MEPSSSASISTVRHSWKIVKRIRELFQQAEKIGQLVLHISELQNRVAELEKKLERCPGEACPHCGAHAYRINHIADLGFSEREFFAKCQDCGFEDHYRVLPTQRR